MKMTEKNIIALKLKELMLEHQDLDDVINRLSSDPLSDKLRLQRLKKRKLVIKDQINQ
jgi:hypothetical protein